MSNVAKRINIVSIKMVKESSFLYQTRKISSPKDAYEMIKEQLEGLDREQFIIACLNTKNEPTNISVVSVGTLNKALDREQFIIACLNTKNEPTNISVVSVGTLNKAIVHPREVFKTAILSNASSIMAFHNHPSGDTTPSDQDIQLTHRLVEAGELLGIKLLDHLIIGDGSFTSLKEKGYL